MDIQFFNSLELCHISLSVFKYQLALFLYIPHSHLAENNLIKNIRYLLFVPKIYK